MEIARVGGRIRFAPLPGIWLVVAVFFLAGLYFGLWSLPGFSLFVAAAYVFGFFYRIFIYIPWMVFFLSCALLLRYTGYPICQDVPSGSSLTFKGRAIEVIPGQENCLLLSVDRAMVEGKVFKFRKAAKIFKRGKWNNKLIGRVATLSVSKANGRYFYYGGGFILSKDDIFSRFFRFLSSIRHGMYRIAKSRLTQDEFAVAMAVFLGIRQGPYYEIRNALYDIGAGHILAISGLHLGIIMGLFYFLLSFLRAGYYLRHFCLVVACLLYMSLAGWWSMSLLRAGAMFLVWSLARFLAREISVYDALGLAILIIGIVDCRLLFSYGFQFSCISVLSISLMHSVFGNKGKGNLLLSVFWVSLSAFLGVSGLVMLYFRRIAWFAVFSNVLFVPLLAVLLISGVIFFVSLGAVSLPFKASVAGLLKLSSVFSFAKPIIIPLDIGLGRVVFLYYAIVSAAVFYVMYKDKLRVFV